MRGVSPGVKSIATASLHTWRDLLYPPSCVFCAAPLQDTSATGFCDNCVDEICGPPNHRCSRCGRVARGLRELPAGRCQQCEKESLPFKQVVVIGDYQGAMREAIIASKKYAHEPIAMALGRLLAQKVRVQMESVPQSVTFVPSHWQRQLGRGTTPAQTLACQIAKALQRPICKAIRPARKTAKQSILSAEARAANVKDAFKSARRFRWTGQSFLLVDDVVTTGATTREITRVLLRAGAKSVFVAAAARGLGKT